MKLSWNIGDVVEVLEENEAPIAVGSRGEIIELCDDNTEDAYYGINFRDRSGFTWYYGQHYLKLISKANDELTELNLEPTSDAREDIRFLLEQIYNIITGDEGDFSKIKEVAQKYNFRLGEYVEDIEDSNV